MNRLLLKALIAFALFQIAQQPHNASELVHNCRLNIAHASLMLAQALV